ncbi:MAG: hypothetical protein HS124_06825 [Anaerolineales bacterium]|nr:hypothetical protein [Anaerolineales bacterium]
MRPPRCTVVFGQIDLTTGGVVGDPMRKLISSSDRNCQHISKGVNGNEKKRQAHEGMEEAHPFAGMSQVNEYAAGVDIGAEEIVVCVAGDGTYADRKAFGNYTVDLQNIGKWLREHQVKTVAMESTGSIGFRCLKNWNGRVLSAC